MASAPDRVGLLIVRAWIEDGADPPALRARITITHDLTAREIAPRTFAAAEIDAVCDAVRTWLEAFVAGAASGDQPPV